MSKPNHEGQHEDASGDPYLETEDVNEGNDVSFGQAVTNSQIQQQQQAPTTLAGYGVPGPGAPMWPAAGIRPHQQIDLNASTALVDPNLGYSAFAMSPAWGVPGTMDQGTAAYFSSTQPQNPGMMGQADTSQLTQAQADSNAQFQSALQQQQQLMWQQMLQMPMAAMMQSYGAPAGVAGVPTYPGANAAVPPFYLPGTAAIAPTPSLDAGLGSMNRAARPKKNKAKPKRPLSAYNLFFKDERVRMLKEIPSPDKEENKAKEAVNSGTGENPEESAGVTDKEATTTDQTTTDKEAQTSSSSGANRDSDEKDKAGGDDKKHPAKSSRKRKRQPHGKITFEKMAQVIGKRWKQIDSVRLAGYKKIANEDLKRYKKEMEGFNLRQRQGLEECREQLESTVDDATKARYFASGGVVKKRDS